MKGEYVLILTILLSLLIFVVQRTEAKYRFWVILLMLLTAGSLLRNFVIYRQLEGEGWLSLGIAFFLNFMFWLLVGRYNPVGSSDKNIQVLGMDD